MNAIAVVIPTLDEAEELPQTLRRLAGCTSGLDIVVADGGSTDGTQEVARTFDVRVVTAPPGRASQMNAGARVTAGDPIVFLHADTRFGPDHVAAMTAALMDPAVAFGSFSIRVGGDGLAMRLVSFMANLRTRLDRTPYGDQAMFVRRHAFEQVGGFPDVSIMEDALLGRRLHAVGRFAFIARPAVVTSARRWQRDGVVRTTIRNVTVRLLWELGVSPPTLRRIYQAGRGSRAATGRDPRGVVRASPR